MMIRKGLFLFISFFFLFSATAFAEEIEEYNVDINVKEDGSIDVVEKILYNFEDELRHGLLRDLPILYGGPGEEVEIALDVEKVTDENGVPYQYEESDDYYSMELRIGDPDEYVDGKKWYYIYYTAGDVINGFPDHDELYWNATGTEWDVIIDHAVVNVKVPGGMAENKIATCFTGAFGENDQFCTAEVTSDMEYHFETTSSLSYYSGLTVVAGFEKGMVATPGVIIVGSVPGDAKIYLDGADEYGVTPRRYRLAAGEYLVEVKKWKYYPFSKVVTLREGEEVEVFTYLQKKPLFIFLETIFPVVLFLLGVLWIFFLWWFRGRDPEGRGTIMPFYKAPKLKNKAGDFMAPISPGVLGVLIDEQADLHDITGSIIQLAVKGLIKIRKDKVGNGKKEKITAKNYTFIKLREPKKGELLDFEQKIFDALFASLAKGKKEVKLDALNKKFYKKLPKIKEMLYKHVVSKGYFVNNPDDVRNIYAVGGIIFIVVALIFGGLMAVILQTGLYLYLLPLIGALMIIFSSVMPKKTKAGAEVYEKVLGYKMFLNAAEKDRIKVLFSPDEYRNVFAENLPYAIVMGVDKQWAKQFKGLYDAVPDWYEGDDSLIAFVSSLQTFNNLAQDTYVSKPTPSYSGKGGGWGSGWSGGSSSWSGGSGFSGGGFSGGGFGGGGGSSW